MPRPKIENTRNNTYRVRVNKQEEEMLQYVCEKKELKNKSEVFRSALKETYEILRLREFDIIENQNYYFEENEGISLERIINCPYCLGRNKIDLVDEADSNTSDRQMGPETIYNFNTENNYCNICNNQFRISGYISEYPIGVFNYEEINVYPIEIKEEFKMSQYREKFFKTILDGSESNTWDCVVNEWEIIDCEEDVEAKSTCICGKENIRYLFSIQNIHNKKIINPLGSSCIKKFERKELNQQVLINEKLFQLLHKLKESFYIPFTPEYFSRNLLKFFYENGAFIDTEFNKFNGKNDYDFILKMFNKKKKPTVKETKKIDAIILNSIKPFLIKKLAEKVRKKN